MKNIYRLLMLIIVCFPFNANAGNNSSGSDKIGTKNIDISTVDDVVILNDEIELIFSGENSDFIYHEVRRKIRYKVNSQEGIERISKVIIPESLDPSMINHFPEARNYDHVYSRMKVDHFKAEIISPNGDKKVAEVEDDVESLKMHMLEENYYGTYYKYNYLVKTLGVGDELYIEYQYNMQFDENLLKLTSNRIFFNSDIAKKNYKLTIRHHDELVVDYEYFNMADPDTVYDSGSTRFNVWTRKDLGPDMNEVGSRPYMNLPYITFTVKPYNFLYKVPHTFEDRLQPLYTLYTGVREQLQFGISVSIMQGVNTRQYNNIEKFIESETKGLENDSIGYDRIKKIHHKIADDFIFDDDLPYFTREDRRDPRMGDYLASGKIRDISRNDIYLALIQTAGLRYFTTYLCDVRSGILSDNFLVPMHYSDMMYTVFLNNDDVALIYPKKSRFGYYLNEIPFFYEGSRGRLIHLNDYKNTEAMIKEDFREIMLPISGIADNVRNSRLMAEVNIEEQSVTFTGIVSLSGQFSTMTRGLYQHGYVEHGINELYSKKLWDINQDVDLISSKVDVQKKEAPFTTGVRAKYKVNNILKIDNDTIKLDISNWFNHIIYENIRADNRETDFYFDFSGRDTYSYMIQFDKDVELLPGIENFEINNELISCIINVEQVHSKAIKIESYLAVGNKIESDQINIVKEVFDRIQELNKGEIRLIVN